MNTMTAAKSLAPEALHRHDISSHLPTVLTDIYREETNIVVWEREPSETLTKASAHVVKTKPNLQISAIFSPQSAYTTIHENLGSTQEAAPLCEDIAQLVDMFCCLFDLKKVGLRLASLNNAMCPRFHVDNVPCRLVTTYWGEATQWLPHHLVDHSKLGAGSHGKRDEKSGLFDRAIDIRQLMYGDVALLKGEMWDGNSGAGLVHRSPQLEDDCHRLLLTLDFAND